MNNSSANTANNTTKNNGNASNVAGNNINKSNSNNHMTNEEKRAAADGVEMNRKSYNLRKQQSRNYKNKFLGE